MNNEQLYSVYKLTSPENKVYIGCTSQNSKDRWGYGSKYHHNEKLTADIKKFGWGSFIHEVLYYGLKEDEAYELEKELIHKYKSSNPDYGYNKSIGGKTNTGILRSDEYRRKLSERTSGERHHFYGKHLSEEHRQKISQANMGHSVDEETRRKIGEGNRGKIKSEETVQRWRESRKGYTHSDESKRKISEANRGKLVSEETRRKISEANQGRAISEESKRKMSESSSHKRKVLCIDTGIVYESMIDAAKDVNTPRSNIGSVCTGKTKTAGGYSWKYID